ncbi:diacylglycerol O-acyltransferase 1 [Thrips palmi]|uniref:O-acyltransferase n=1 Tax=Thrips palmi TaxID=161013 RepID=A0A6P8YWU5_THRPL|nr:diacylglycerol O-acyltransferase 1 [Thrips palmi]
MTADPSEDQRVRLRRAKSFTQVEQYLEQETKVRKNQPDRPCHRPRDSLFSWSSGFDNFAGLVNWGFLLLFMGSMRLLLENFIKYGIRVNPKQWLELITGDGGPETATIVIVLYSIVPVVICLLLEKGLAAGILTSRFGLTSHIVNLLTHILLPMVVVHTRAKAFSLIAASSVCMLYSVLFLKLWSYVQVNMWCRNTRQMTASKAHQRRQSISVGKLALQGQQAKSANGVGEKSPKKESDLASTKPVQYPDNLSLRDLYYFILAPTLCYELNFPRSTRIRKRFLIKRLLEVLIGIQVMMSLFQQWIIPSVKNSLIPFSNMEAAKAVERLLKLAIPNHLVWLCFFYLTFHSWLNLMGELLHFADRNFYLDWWNSNNIDTFWRSWNMPVHRWAVRHLFIPLIEAGYTRVTATIAVFFISAFFHEFLVSVPLRTFKTWAFMGMMGQVPLSLISRWVEKRLGPRWGNMTVWASLILGQPLCIMMYYHDYVVTHFGEALIDSYGHV